jgi:hypothetical protein
MMSARRHLSIALVVVLASCSVSDAQEWARAMFDSTSHEFGAVARDSKTQHAFTITNKYKEDVHIASVRSSCGCASPEATTRTLKTHEKGQLIAHFNTRAFLGQRQATITVTFDKPFFAEVQLQVAGYIRSDVVFDPPSFELGSVDHGTSVEKRMQVRYAGRNDWRIIDIQTTSPHLDVTATETGRGRGQVAYELVVRLADDAPVGYLNDQIWLVTNDSRAARVPIQLEGRIIADITVSPASLFMGIVKPGQSVTKKLVVRSKKPFRVVSVECDDDCFKFRKPQTARAVHLIPVTFTAGNKPGKMVGTIRIETDLGEDTIHELVAYAQVAPSSGPNSKGS